MLKLVLYTAIAANVFLVVTSTVSSHKCKKNEQYSDCINGECNVKTCSQLGLGTEPCEEIHSCDCISGCICKDGYVRADNGTCIKKADCPSCGDDPNAVSGCGVFCHKCSNYGQSNIACPEFCKINGCECRDGFIQDDVTKKCVRPTECTPTCKKHEVFSNCTNGGCEARNCTQLGKDVPCVKIGPKKCIKGCVCAEGYLKDGGGTCIPKEKCPACGDDPNATSGCGTFCNRCRGPIPCPKICKINGCDCKDGHVYDDNIQKCVLKKQCTPTCKKHEVFSNCTNGGCEARNCTQLGKDVPCVKISPKKCIKGCVCAEGYLRDGGGTCIPKEKCPACGDDPNATSGCGTFCNRCRGPIPCPKICKINGCDCKDGHVYDDNIQKCVLKKQCTPTCKKHEVFSNCTNGGCEARNCTQLGNNVPCGKIDPKNCIKGCVCAKGYLRDEGGTCIPKKKCPACGDDPNATSGCGTFCNRCRGPIPCPKICKTNGCDCKDGHVYDDNIQKCVLKKQCTPTCKKNEVFSNCTQSGCSAKNCTQLGKPVPCIRIDPKFCIKGCVCDEGYVRAYNGTCILKKDCPSCGGDPNAVSGCGVFCYKCSNTRQSNNACPGFCQINGCECRDGFIQDDVTKKCVRPSECTPTCKKHEVFSNCTNGGCEARNCTQLGKDIPCVKIDPKNCIKGCVCAEGYLKDEGGTCIPKKKCPACGDDPNATSGCGTFCNRCRGPIPCPTFCKKNGCDCKDGYIYDASIKKCVRPEQCTTTCKPNEVFSNCTQSGCGPKNCSQLGKPVPCAKIDPKTCVKGCVCVKGFVRADNGTCIKTEHCPSCGGDPNAQSGCGGFCTRCSNYKKHPVCTLACDLNGCDCKKDFIFDDIIKKCVRPEQCTTSCPGPNEVYDPCDSPCPARRCDFDPTVALCMRPPQVGDKECLVGCRCKDGFFRNHQNVCVRREQCQKKCQKNEEFDLCPDCNPRLCETRDNVYHCPLIPADTSDPKCKPTCRCKKGFFRDHKGKCVRAADCDKCEGPNEFFECGVACDNVCGSKIGRKNCNIYNVKCNPKCYCKDGFARAANKTCVPVKDCPSRTCNKNEEYSSCANGQCRLENCTQYGDELPFCPKFDQTKCKGGCVCLKGYLRNAHGHCVPQEECPEKKCQKNEEFDLCPDCDPRLCETRDRVYDCPLIPADTSDPKCKPRCRCKKGFFRDHKGKCVRAADCDKCEGPNEFFECGVACDNVCGSKIGRKNCNIYNVKCNPKCYCKDGFARAANNTCIPVQDCPSHKCKGPNEFFECGPVCDNVCGRKIGRKNCNIKKIQCDQKCYCKDGFARAANNTCVPVKDCPSTSCPGPNEVYDPCDAPCPARRCDFDPTVVKCARPPQVGDKECLVGCRCKDGFFRNHQNICVRREQCPQKCNKNEEYSSCANGQCRLKNCTQCGDPIPVCHEFDKTTCKSGCVCLKGYLRNAHGHCVPQEECPEATTSYEELEYCDEIDQEE